MRQFGYTQTISRHPNVFVPLGLTRMQIKEIYADYQRHMVSDESRPTRAPRDWSCVDGYIMWFFTVSHPHIVPTAEG
ncbi:unnamed protein product [Lathyrus sativus]|nr:unnamed protein product [Lathyrus sativus]